MLCSACQFWLATCSLFLIQIAYYFDLKYSSQICTEATASDVCGISLKSNFLHTRRRTLFIYVNATSRLIYLLHVLFVDLKTNLGLLNILLKESEHFPAPLYN